MPAPAIASTQAAEPVAFRATPTVIITLSLDGKLCAELPGPAGRRKLELAEGKIEETLRTVLKGMARKAYAIGEDGAPTQSQVRHWERHDIWSDPQCPHCVGEGRFPPKVKNHDRRITKADAAALALRARGYVERNAGKWYRQGFATVVVSPSGVVSSPNLGKWTKEDTTRLREEGQREANMRQYTSPQFRRDVLVAHGDGTVVRKTQSTKASREAAIAAKVERVMRTITF